jgi:hypothetical protein
MRLTLAEFLEQGGIPTDGNGVPDFGDAVEIETYTRDGVMHRNEVRLEKTLANLWNRNIEPNLGESPFDTMAWRKVA